MAAADLNEAKRALLTSWIEQRDRLEVLISALRAELGETVKEPVKPEQSATVTNATSPLNVNELVVPGDFLGMSQVEAIQTFLQRTQRRTASPQEIALALYRGKAVDSPIEGEKQFKNLSSLLSKTDAFFSVARGRWGLTEWYPKSVIDKREAKRTEKSAAVEEEEKTA